VTDDNVTATIIGLAEVDGLIPGSVAQRCCVLSFERS